MLFFAVIAAAVFFELVSTASNGIDDEPFFALLSAALSSICAATPPGAAMQRVDDIEVTHATYLLNHYAFSAAGGYSVPSLASSNAASSASHGCPAAEWKGVTVRPGKKPPMTSYCGFLESFLGSASASRLKLM